MYEKSDFDAVVKSASLRKEIEVRIGQLKPSGTTLTACCPFHSEKSPSFHVSESKNIWKCFGCGESGDVITFVSKYDNISPLEAMRKIAKDYGIKVMEPKKEEEIASIVQMYTALKVAAIEFASKLLHDRSIKRYVYERGIINVDILKTWNIGYAPEAYEIIADEKAMVDSGLKKPDGKMFFRNRLMFPIEDVAGRIVGFTARALSTDQKQKYINTPETEVYHKSKHLYGMRQALNAMRENKSCIVVEGPFDVIAMHNAGYNMTVGSLGTSLTIEHAQLLIRYCNDIVLMYDGDTAGKKATVRAIPNLWEAGFKTIEVAVLPEGKDPADCANDDFKSISSVSFLYNYIDEEDLEKKIIRIIEIISKCPSPVRRDILIRELAEESKMSQYSLVEELNNSLKKRIK